MLRFEHLPDFAAWLLNNIDAYTGEVVRLFYETKPTLLQALQHLSEEERFAFSKRLNIEFLTNLSQNNASGHIEAVTSRWLSDTFENVSRRDIDARDITVINHVRSRAQKKFIDQYTKDPERVYQLHAEIDDLAFAYNSRSIDDYLQVLKDRITTEATFSSQIIEASPGIVFIYDLQKQRKTYINGRVEGLTGYTPQEILAEPNMLMRLTHPDDLPMLGSLFGQLHLDREGKILTADCRFKVKNDNYKWLRFYCVIAKREEDGTPQQVLGTAYDVNREKEMAFELAHSNEQLQEFAAIASHDLKEPLRKIGLFANIIMTTDWDELPESAKTNLQKISDAALRMQKLIEGVLSYSAINAQTHKEVVNLEGILQEAIYNLEFKIAESSARIESDGLPEAPVIPLQLQQLFQNLLANALKFARKLTPPRVQISHRFLSAEEISDQNLQPAQQYLRIEFADNGIGFDSEAAEKIFGLFQRLHNRSDFEGSGIGLAICKRIIEHHGGTISASSREGMGATFIILLPMQTYDVPKSL